MDYIVIKGARVHNLKNIDLKIPKNKLVVISGLSGSGKTTIAFDTIFAEGQRRYLQSLSSFTKQYLNLLEKPDIDYISNLSPTIAISQKQIGKSPRSTVGTITEIYDYMRLLFSKIGTPYCPDCNKVLHKKEKSKIIEEIKKYLKRGDKIFIYSPVCLSSHKNIKKIYLEIRDSGYMSVLIDNKNYDVSKMPEISDPKSIKILIDAFFIEKNLDLKRLVSSISSAADLSKGFVSIGIKNKKGTKKYCFSEHYNCKKCGFSMEEEIDTRLFSFNNPYGACRYCHGLGYKKEIDPELLIPNKNLSIAEGAIKPWTQVFSHMKIYDEFLETIANRRGFSVVNTPVCDLNKNKLNLILYGDKQSDFKGIISYLNDKYIACNSDYIKKEIEKYMRDTVCSHCKGKRLRPEGLSVKIGNESIVDLSDMSLVNLAKYFKYLKNNLCEQELKIAKPIIKEAAGHLRNLIKVSLGYLTLSRPSLTLAGGESQRIRLATQINSGLTGILYILDEPSIGMHARDNQKLLDLLTKLKNLKNSVIVVEHDENTIKSADYLIDIGPGAGEKGGRVIASGKPEKVFANPKSITGQYISGKLNIPTPKKRRQENGKKIEIIGASANNLKNIDIKIPLKMLIGVSGVSGSGKSSLVIDILAKALKNQVMGSKRIVGKHKKINGFENLDKLISINQSPIGRSPRSNPATYIGFFNAIRDLFANSPAARMKGFKSGSFSFNVKGGRCENCRGDGQIKIEMRFLPDVYVKCPECDGKRYISEILDVYVNDKNIGDVLNMTVDSAMHYFKDQSAIYEKLKVLSDVGLSYLRLGQPATQLSGGEAQRIKLASELIHKSTGNTLYILDEPTTGLHFDDIKKLLLVLNRLVDAGNTVIIIEHNLDVLKSCDWIIDLGPEGGDEGGFLVAEGTPEQVAENEKSYTGQYLKKVLEK